MISSVNPPFFRPTRIIPSDKYKFISSVLTIFYGHISAIGSLCAVMFKRSFVSKDRAGKTVKVAKKKYDELVKEKMKQKVESPSMGRCVLFFIYKCGPALSIDINTHFMC